MSNKPYCGYIYRVINTCNGKSYVGKSSRDIGARWREHIKCAVMGKKAPLYEAMRKDGFKHFEFNIVEYCYGTEADLDELEIHYINKFDSHANGYNGDVGGSGRKASQQKKPAYQKALHGVTKGRKPVRGVHIKTGNVVTFNSLTEAAKAVGGQGSKIGNVARGVAKTAYGYTWSWLDA